MKAVFFLLAIFCLDCKIKHYCLLVYQKGLLKCVIVHVLASTMNDARYYDNMIATEKKKNDIIKKHWNALVLSI